jgi:hypothetical protein
VVRGLWRLRVLVNGLPVNDDDIARIARLRGRDPANYQRAEVTTETLATKLGPRRVRSLFYAPEDSTTDVLVYDALPRASRVFIREAQVHMSALKYSELLEAAEGDQSALIGLLSQVIPMRVQEVVRARYGSRHPQAGE